MMMQAESGQEREMGDSLKRKASLKGCQNMHLVAELGARGV